LTPETVVFVCTGNTCRSPLAAALAARRWPDGPVFLSAGLQASGAQPAAEAAQAVAAERGCDLGSHRSRRLDDELLASAGWLIGMTRSHVAQLNALLARRPSGHRTGLRVGLLGRPNEDLASRATPADEEVADPYGAPVETYRAVADQLDRLLAAWDESFSGAGRAGGGRA
jgi:protein-tyrosine-phosphatase